VHEVAGEGEFGCGIPFIVVGMLPAPEVAMQP
jgi:hypothetical protein